MTKLTETDKIEPETIENTRISVPLLAFTFFYSIAIYILMLSFYFWQWRKDIKQEKQTVFELRSHFLAGNERIRKREQIMALTFDSSLNELLKNPTAGS